MEEDKEFIKAKDYAYRLLSYRQRSIKELKGRLKRKGFSPKIIKATVEYLSQLNYLNDENFAKFWIQSKIQSRPIGYLLLRYQLRQKGVAEEILNKVFSDFAKDYDEYDAARQIVVSRGKHYRRLKPLKLKRRLFAYLHRRGFSQEAISQAIDETIDHKP